MKRKTMIAAAIAGALGCSMAFAASSPLSVADNKPWIAQSHELISGPVHHALGSTSSQAGGTVSSFSGDSLNEPLQLSGPMLDQEETLALADEGIYSDFYRVSLAPLTFEEWDYYILSPMSSSESEDLYVLTPAYSVVFFSSEEGSAM